MCIDGYGPAQIAKALRNDNILIPTAYEQSKGKGGTRPFRNPTYWGEQTINSQPCIEIQVAWLADNVIYSTLLTVTK